MSELTHFNTAGEAHMVDVSAKPITQRVALAEGWIFMQASTLQRISAGTHAKGDVLGVARLAGIMGAKRTADLIPLCHPLPLSKITLDLHPEPSRNALRCQATVATLGRTGVEMEALMAVQIALLTVYDMCKALSHAIVLGPAKLLGKRGGKRDVGTLA